MSSTLGTWDKINNALGSTNTSFGGEWGNLISDFMNGIDVGLSDPTKRPRPNTLTRFKNEKLGLFDVDESHHVLFSVADIDTGVDRKIIIRRMNAPNETDYMVMENLTQTLTAKTISLSVNTVTDTFSNMGDLVKHNGSGFVRWAKGTALQVPRVTSDGLDVEWVDLNDVSVISKGTILKSGNAVDKVFTIPHGMATTPVAASVTPSSTDAMGSYVVDVNPTHIVITYSSAPPSGTDNLEFLWITTSALGGIAGVGEANTISNIGAGSQVFKLKNNFDFQLRSLVGGAGINTTQNTNDITIDVDSTVLRNDLDNSFGAHYFDMNRTTAPANPAANNARFYNKQIDSNNDGWFCLVKKNGSFQEVQIV